MRSGASSWLSLVVVSLLGCGDTTPHGSPTSPNESSVAELVRTDPRIERLFVSSELRADGEGARKQARRPDDSQLTLPLRADGFVELRDGDRARPLVRVRTLGSTGDALDVRQGVATYARALGGDDVIWLAKGKVAEQLVMVRSPEDRFELGWELCPRSDLSAQEDASGALVLEGPRGEPVLSIPPAYARDALGHRRDMERVRTSAESGCERLAFVLDTHGLVPPLLVDPALEAVTWVKKTFPISAAIPPARLAHGMAYDPVRKKVVVFGGQTTWDPDPYFADTWEYDATGWKKVTTSVAPSGRRDFGMTYSPVHGGIVLHGGIEKKAGAPGGLAANAETWVYDGDWSKLPPGPDDPPVMFAHALAFDSVRSVVVLYGGSSEFNNETVWELSLTGWKQSSVSTTPGPQNLFGMAFHEALGAVVTFGGLRHLSFDVLADETWTFNGTTWLESTSASPSGRYQVRLSYDDKRDRALMFGGYDNFTDLDETWELLDDGTWDLRPTVNAPFPRSDAGLAYDADRDRTVLYGGWTAFEYDETWEYLNFGNACTTPAACDGFPCVDGVCCSVTTCGTCEACSPVSGKCQPVTELDDADSCTGTTTCDSSGACKKKNGETCQSGTECASGNCADGVCCNQACQSACESCAAPGKIGSCSFVTGEAAHGVCPANGTQCGASCDGTQATCVFASLGTDCGSSCEAGSLTERSCDGLGSCSVKSPNACPNHLTCADPQGCASACANDADCAAGYRCEKTQCVDKSNVCVDEVTGQSASGVVESCVPFRCKGSGCLSSCNSSQDCAPGFVCDADSRCTRAPSEKAQDEGCGCRMVGARSGPAWVVLLAALAFVLGRRRA